MVAKLPAEGLIATRRAGTSLPLEELQVSFRWPVVWDANVRRLQHELALRCPTCVLFWLEEGRGLAETAQLIAWMRERGSRPYRLAAGYRLEANAESALRAAGAHSYLPISGEVAATVSNAWLPLLGVTEQPADSFIPSRSMLGAGGRPQPYETERALVRPP